MARVASRREFGIMPPSATLRGLGTEPHTKRTARPPVGAIAVAGAIVLPPLFATGQSWELIPLAAIGALTALFWRPIRVWAARLEEAVPSSDEAALHEALAALRRELDAMAREQRQLRELVHWQEQLLRRAKLEGAPPRASGGAGRERAVAGEAGQAIGSAREPRRHSRRGVTQVP